MTGTYTPEAPATQGLLRWPPVVFLVATALGLILRFGFLGLALPVPFDHLLHAHSHALYFGWAALAILAATAYAPPIRRWAWAGLSLVPLLTVAFLLQGYGPFSIAVSTAVMLVWYGAIVSWWRHRGGDPLFRASFLYLVLASVGIWVLAGLQATGHGEGLAPRLAIHAFLSTFAWALVLGTVSLAVQGGLVGRVSGQRAIRWIGAFGWVLFPLGVMGGPEVPVLGWAGRGAAVAVVVPTAFWVKTLWQSHGGTALRLGAAWLGMAVTGLVAAAVGGSSLLGAVGRPGIVIYLHALLLGYVSTVLIWYLSPSAVPTRALSFHHLGVAVMLAGVAGPLAGIEPLASNRAAAIGAVLVWGAAWGWSVPLWRRT